MPVLAPTHHPPTTALALQAMEKLTQSAGALGDGGEVDVQALLRKK